MIMTVYWRDLTERVALTFAEGFVGGVVVTEMSNQSMWLSAVAGGVAAAASLLKGLLAKKVGNPDSASLDGDV